MPRLPFQKGLAEATSNICVGSRTNTYANTQRSIAMDTSACNWFNGSGSLQNQYEMVEQAGGCRVSAPRLLRVAGARAARVRLLAPGLNDQHAATPTPAPTPAPTPPLTPSPATPSHQNTRNTVRVSSTRRHTNAVTDVAPDATDAVTNDASTPRHVEHHTRVINTPPHQCRHRRRSRRCHRRWHTTMCGTPYTCHHRNRKPPLRDRTISVLQEHPTLKCSFPKQGSDDVSREPCGAALRSSCPIRSLSGDSDTPLANITTKITDTNADGKQPPPVLLHPPGL